jgi:hypothetical protein
MPKVFAAALAAIFIAASSLAHGQAVERLSPADLGKITDARIEIVKSALQLSPDQAKHWPAVEDAIRARAQNRHGRVGRIVETVGRGSDESVVELLRNRDPIEFMNRRSDALAQRSADLKKLADAWQPLYKTFTPEQKRRMAALAIIGLRQMSHAIEQRRNDDDDDDDSF